MAFDASTGVAVVYEGCTVVSNSRSQEPRLAMLTGSVSRNGGGLFSVMTALSHAIAERGSEVRVFGAVDEWTTEDAAEWEGVLVSVQRVIGPIPFGYQKGLLKRLRAFRPDIVHVHGLWTYPSAATVQWSAGASPYIISPHGMLDPWALANSRWKKRIASLLYEGAHLFSAKCLHALCETERDAMRAYGLKNPICIIPNGVKKPKPVDRLKKPAWADSIPDGAKVMLFLGRIHPKKGLERFLQAWHLATRLKAISEDWYLVIAGWDQKNHEAQLRALANDLAIDERLRFVGPQFGEAKDASYGRAQAFVLPSLSEGLPMAVLEAWSYRLPVLMTAQCNLSIGFQYGAALELQNDIRDAARCLGVLNDMSDGDRELMGANGCRLIQEHFSWGIISLQMQQVYTWMLGGGGPPSFVDLIAK